MGSSSERNNPPFPSDGASADTQVSRLDGVNEDLYVLSYPVPQLRFPIGLTTAERQIVSLLLDGLTTAEIATIRASAQSTVSKQLAGIYRKANVRSRRELIAWMLARENRSADKV